MNINQIDNIIDENVSIEIEIEVIRDLMYKLLDDGTIRSRAVKFRVQKYLKGNDIYKKLYAINKIITDGKGLEVPPTLNNIKIDFDYFWLLRHKLLFQYLYSP